MFTGIITDVGTGKITAAYVMTSNAALAKVKGVQIVNKGYEGITYQLTVEINHRRKELADLRVRRAIAHAIDRRFVVDASLRGISARHA